MKLEPLARPEGLGCGKGQRAEPLGTVNEEAVCGHMSQGLFLKNPNDSQMEGVEGGSGGREASRKAGKSSGSG